VAKTGEALALHIDASARLFQLFPKRRARRALGLERPLGFGGEFRRLRFGMELCLQGRALRRRLRFGRRHAGQIEHHAFERRPGIAPRQGAFERGKTDVELCAQLVELALCVFGQILPEFVGGTARWEPGTLIGHRRRDRKRIDYSFG
jgi:hypothetical protein